MGAVGTSTRLISLSFSCVQSPCLERFGNGEGVKNVVRKWLTKVNEIFSAVVSKHLSPSMKNMSESSWKLQWFEKYCTAWAKKKVTKEVFLGFNFVFDRPSLQRNNIKRLTK